MEKIKSFVKKDTMIKGVKIALGSTFAILVCMLLELENAASAGIITLLTIQNTTRDTLDLAKYRYFSFIFSMAAAYAASRLFPSTTIGFCAYILVMVIFSSAMDWQNTISVNAVFGTHIFIMNEHFSIPFLFNEFMILTIGVVIAVALNLKMPQIEKDIKNDIDLVEHSIMLLLYEISEKIRCNKPFNQSEETFEILASCLDDAVNKSIINRGNTLQQHSEFYINFFMLRKNQIHLLYDMYKSLQDVDFSIVDATASALFFRDISDTFSINNTAHPRFEELNVLMKRIRSEELPKDYETFSVKATLFHCLKELEEFFTLKQEFLDNLSEEQEKIYLNLRKH